MSRRRRCAQSWRSPSPSASSRTRTRRRAVGPDGGGLPPLHRPVAGRARPTPRRARPAARHAHRSRGGAPGDDRGAVGDDAAARARLGAAARGCERPARGGPDAAARRRDGRRDHVLGSVSKRLAKTQEPLDPGLVSWAAEYLNERVAGLQLGTHQLRQRFDDPGLSVRERARSRAPPAFYVHAAGARGAAALRRRRREPARRGARAGARRVPTRDRPPGTTRHRARTLGQHAALTAAAGEDGGRPGGSDTARRRPGRRRLRAPARARSVPCR